MRTTLEKMCATPPAPQPETPEELRAEAAKLRAEAVALRAKADRREASDWQRDMEDCAEQDAADSRVPFADGCLRCRAESDKQPSLQVRNLVASLMDGQRRKEYDPSYIRDEAYKRNQRAHDLELDATGTCDCGCPRDSGWGHRLYLPR